ncbi:putative reverse transcriptase domain-containing protein [Tanacetum coccineum]|uniref:Reverse transcriptase domain-containing protein n=1 Tax=Tanacetum coccineum TaxID=301880 RepID=A0ABQ5HI09_9ASTR
MSATAIERLISQRIADALLTYEANRNSGNENGNGNGDVSHDLGIGNRRPVYTTRGCTYKEFLKCQPLKFKGTEGAVGLAYWFEKMEYVFHISNCAVECQVKYATCTLLSGALTWWKSHVRTVGHNATYDMPWKNLMKTMTEAYCTRSEIKKLETEMVPDETDKVERYVGGFPDSIQGSVMASKPKMLQEAIELTNNLMDQKVHAYAARQADDKRRMDSNLRDNYVQQPPYKRHNVARAYTAGPKKKREYTETLPLCNKCKYHHTGPCTAKCKNCKRIGHQTEDCRSQAAAIKQRAPVANQRTLTCFKCGKQGHYHSECLKLKNHNRGNQAGSSEACGRVYALGRGEPDQDPNNIAYDINA